MTKRNRLILITIFSVIFLAVAPELLFYALGYKFDLAKKKFVSTGGIYIRISTPNTQVFVNGRQKKNFNIFDNSILIQGLLPKKYEFSVKKDGYYSWQKYLEIKEKEVIRVENVTLIKEKVVFEKLRDNIKNFYISPKGDLVLLLDSLKYDFSIVDGKTTVEKNSFYLPKNTKPPHQNIGSGGKDNIKVVSWDENLKTIILKTEDNYFSIDYSKPGIINPSPSAKGEGVIEPKTTLFESDEELDTIFSPDNSKFLFFNDHEIFFAETKNPSEKTFLTRFSEKIKDCFWLNDYYLVFVVGDKIKISEIDARDKLNIVDLNPLSEKITEIKNPSVFWDQVNKKLYLLNNNSLFLSEKLFP